MIKDSNERLLNLWKKHDYNDLNINLDTVMQLQINEKYQQMLTNDGVLEIVEYPLDTYVGPA